jgi:serine acetyltransferase/GT2 family glycosyltransferase
VTPSYSVVIATYDRGPALERLLRQLAGQSVPPAEYEVIVVDDGSAEPVAPRLAALAVPYALRVIRQANGGPAAARHAGIAAAAGWLLVIVDDDMQVGADFLAAHARAHPAGSRHAVLGRIRWDRALPLPLFERYHAAMIDRFADGVRAGTVALHGWHLYTGNVSLRRADYLAVGGFDTSLRLSEDAELGIRLERAGVTLRLAEDAETLHSSDHVRLAAWMRRALAYGISESRIAEKHRELHGANPWRFLFLVSRLSRPILLAAARAPASMAAAAWLAMLASLVLAAAGAERAAIAGATLVYGIQYFRGVGRYAGSARRLRESLRRYLGQRPAEGLGRVALFAKMLADLRLDHAAMLDTDAKYRGAIVRRPRLARDLVQRVGLQMMLAYRVMRFLRAAGHGLLARIASRTIRHLYGADIHWDATLAPGVLIVHGVGLVIGHSARVGPGCVLFQHVTIGESIHPVTREVGTPTLEANVHVGPGATLLGPIVVGQGTKITAGALLTQSVPPQSLVETPAPAVRRRLTSERAAASLAVLLALVVLLPACGAAGAADGARGAAAPGEGAGAPAVAIDCARPGPAISPLIYGIAYDPRLDASTQYLWELGATARRWGGNPASRYNWELGNAWNTASDWYFRNVDFTSNPRFTWADFLDANRARGVATALTVPILGQVAKDTSSYAFPVSEFGEQRTTDPSRPDAGDGVRWDGRPLRPGDPRRTSVPAPPEMIGRWVAAIRARDAGGGRGVQMYILDNEPSLWNSTHRDVHPEPTTYDELLERTIAYGTAVRRADPGALIAGPAEWGWPAYLFSAADAVAGFDAKPDRLRHGDVPLVPWYLRRLAEHERRTGVRVLDVLDLHFYPQGKRVFGPASGTDARTAALRIRSTRALWDSTYLDESWIEARVRLIPRMREWIDENYPGLGISIGEWNFGGEEHMSGGLAVAEALGRFGQLGVTSAFYWTYPPHRSPAFHAFRAYRNYDGEGGRFLERSLPAAAPAGVSVFASRDERGTSLVAVALNLDPARPAALRVDHGSCGAAAGRRHFAYTGGAAGLAPAAALPAGGGAFDVVLAPYSINVLEVSLGSRPADAPPAAR